MSLSEQSRALLRIHKLALHPFKVGSILVGIGASFGSVELAARHLNVVAGAALPFGQRQFMQLPALVEARHWGYLAAVFAWMVFVWATLGGGATRRMAQDVTGQPNEPMWRSILFCLRWSLAVPSALASTCFFLILLSPANPWLLTLVLPTWLYAGFLYGALTSERIGLGEAFQRAHARIRNTRVLIRTQLRFLVSFGLSTGAVYALAAVYVLLVAVVFAQIHSVALFEQVSDAQWVATLPVVLYALGYTTSNLKSSQIYLYVQVPELPALAAPAT